MMIEKNHAYEGHNLNKEKIKKELSKNFIKKRFLSLQISMSIVLVVMVLTIVQSRVSRNSIYDSTENALTSTLIETTKEASAHIEFKMKSYINEALSISTLLSNPEKTPTQRLDSLNFAKGQYGFSRIVLLDKNGKNLINKNDFSDTEFYKAAKQDKNYIEDAIIAEENYDLGKYSFKLSVPIYENGIIGGKFLGVVIADSSRDMLSEMVTDVKIGKTGGAYILNQKGEIISAVIDRTKPEQAQAKEPAGLKTIYKNMIAQKTGADTYVSDTTKKKVFMGYAPINGTPGWSIAVYANEADFFSETVKMARFTSILTVLFIILSLIVGVLLSYQIVKPIKKITAKINKFAKLDLTVSSNDSKISRREDEIGIMHQALDEMRNSIYFLMNDIQNTSSVIGQNAEQLKRIAGNTFDSSSDNSAITEELAASMEETAATTEEINEGILHISKNVSEVADKSELGKRLAEEIKGRANEVKITNIEKANHANAVFAEVKEKSNKALLQAKAISKIGDLTKIIKEVAEQTNLLSLNASIEAARAGEQGRGFAVVAKEIGSLAKQVNVAANEISEIIAQTNIAVKGLSDCLSQSISFIEDTAIKNLKDVAASSEQYGIDAASIQNMLSNINEAMETLSSITKQMTSSVSGISAIMEQSTIGISNISEKTTEVVAMSNETNVMAEKSMESAYNLKRILSSFKLEN